MIEAGFVFWGLFVVFGLFVLAYVSWMRYTERREPDAADHSQKLP